MRRERKKSTEALVVEWIIASNKVSITAEEVVEDCKKFWRSRGLYRQGTTFWRAAQRVKELGFLGEIREETCRANGASWLRFHFELAAALNGHARLDGGLFEPEKIPHGQGRTA